MLDLVIQNQQNEFQIPDVKKMQYWVDGALMTEENVQVTLRIVDLNESQGLNKEFRGKDRPTNVLSFPIELPEEFIETLEINMLGDLVVCAGVVEKEAQEQVKTLDSHWAHMLVHGMLHLQGYDHIDDADAEKMEQLEVKILTQLGFDDPYNDEN